MNISVLIISFKSSHLLEKIISFIPANYEVLVIENSLNQKVKKLENYKEAETGCSCVDRPYAPTQVVLFECYRVTRKSADGDGGDGDNRTPDEGRSGGRETRR